VGTKVGVPVCLLLLLVTGCATGPLDLAHECTSPDGMRVEAEAKESNGRTRTSDHSMRTRCGNDTYAATRETEQGGLTTKSHVYDDPNVTTGTGQAYGPGRLTRSGRINQRKTGLFWTGTWFWFPK
jgi:hypothetical protein